MNELSESSITPAWLGQEEVSSAAFNGDGLWVGQHSGDEDLLVFDPAEGDATAKVISFYSLAKHRRRSFPRAAVGTRIKPVTDEVSNARALKDYARRATLQAERDGAREADRSAHAEQQREAVIEAHRRFVEAHGITYKGVERTDGNRKSGRRTKCGSCGIPLDDFAHAACSACDGVLCSCGACACGAAVRGR
jgi:hypothetical protein